MRTGQGGLPANLVTGKPCYIPLGSTSSKQGRVAGAAICGRRDRFPGVIGSCICKVFDFCTGPLLCATVFDCLGQSHHRSQRGPYKLDGMLQVAGADEVIAMRK